MIDTVTFSCYHDLPMWVSFLVLILSNDVELNPGYWLRESFLSFCNWNNNSLSKEKFQRVSLLEARNYLFNYDI